MFIINEVGHKYQIHHKQSLCVGENNSMFVTVGLCEAISKIVQKASVARLQVTPPVYCELWHRDKATFSFRSPGRLYYSPGGHQIAQRDLIPYLLQMGFQLVNSTLRCSLFVLYKALLFGLAMF